MHIIVCLKQIIDPEIPPKHFQIDSHKKRAIRGNAELVINPFDKNSIEVALQIKDQTKDTTVTVITLGGEAGNNALKHALSMGCDEAIWLTDPLYDDFDSFGIVKVLGTAIRKAGKVDIVLCGLQAGDWDMQQVGPFLAEELSLPCISRVFNIEVQANKIFVKKGIEKGTEILEISPPFLATVTNACTNQPRYPTTKEILATKRKRLEVWSASDLQIKENIPRAFIIDGLFLSRYSREAEIIEGETGSEKGIKLAQYIKKMKVI